MQKSRRSSAPHPSYFPRLEPGSINPWPNDQSSDPTDDALAQLNQRMDALPLPNRTNESDLSEILVDLEACGNPCTKRYKLLTARLLEAALICAGHYADHYEFCAAGDLLLNPRKVWIHVKNHSRPILKQRHTSLGRQFSDWIDNACPPPLWFKQNTLVEIAQPALLPYLRQCLEQWENFTPCYLDDIQQRMNQVSDTIGFLSAWSVSDASDLHRRIQNASENTRRWINEHLCRFNTRHFFLLGHDIERLQTQADYQSPFLNQIPVYLKESMK